jgi:hypothetical protein
MGLFSTKKIPTRRNDLVRAELLANEIYKYRQRHHNRDMTIHEMTLGLLRVAAVYHVKSVLWGDRTMKTADWQSIFADYATQALTANL